METRNWEVLKHDLHEQEYCKNLYLSGEGWTQTKLAHLYGVSFSSMQKFIQKQKWAKKKNLDNPTNKRKYQVNDEFFAIQNSVMAYWLGFLASDGYCVKTTNEFGVGLSTVDIGHLEKLKADLKADNPIKSYVNSEGFSCSKLIVTSKKMREDLAQYSIIPEKTFKLEWPSLLKREYWIDYVRGYFDGDGSVSYLSNQHALKWQICGAQKDFLQHIVDFLFEDYGIPRVNVQTYNNDRVHPLYNIAYSTRSTERIYGILYHQDCRYLERKKVKFEECLKRHDEDVPRTI